MHPPRTRNDVAQDKTIHFERGGKKGGKKKRKEKNHVNIEEKKENKYLREF